MSLQAFRIERVNPGRVRRLTIAIAGIVLASAIAAGQAWAAWTSSAAVSPAGGDAAEADVAVNSAGDAVIAWERFDGANTRIQARIRFAGGGLSAVQTLSRTGQNAIEPDAAIDDDGDAVIAWERFDGANTRIQARGRSAGGTLDAVQTLSAAGTDADRVRVVSDLNGDSVFAWQTAAGRVRGRSRDAAGALGPMLNLSPAADFSFSPDVAITAGGDAVFVWTRFSTSTFDQQIQVRRRSAAGVLDATQTLSGAGGPADRPHVDVDPDSGGDAVIAWQRFVGSDVRIQARARSAAGLLSATQTLSQTGQAAEAPEVAVATDGDSVFAWERSDGSNNRMQGRTRTAGGALGPVLNLSAGGADSSDVELGIDASSGDSVFVWEREITMTRGEPLPSARIQARTLSAAGALGVIDTLSGNGAEEPRVDLGEAGDAVAVWEIPIIGERRIQASAGP